MLQDGLPEDLVISFQNGLIEGYLTTTDTFINTAATPLIFALQYEDINLCSSLCPTEVSTGVQSLGDIQSIGQCLDGTLLLPHAPSPPTSSPPIIPDDHGCDLSDVSTPADNEAELVLCLQDGEVFVFLFTNPGEVAGIQMDLACTNDDGTTLDLSNTVFEKQVVIQFTEHHLPALLQLITY